MLENLPLYSWSDKLKNNLKYRDANSSKTKGKEPKPLKVYVVFFLIKPKDTLIVNSSEYATESFLKHSGSRWLSVLLGYTYSHIVLKTLFLHSVTKGPSASFFICTSFSAKKFQAKLFNSCWTNTGKKIQNNLPLENREKQKCKTEQIFF